MLGSAATRAISLHCADVVGHQLFGEHVLALPHGLDGHRVMHEERHGDDHRLDVRVVEQLVVVVGVDLDVLPALRVLQSL